MISPIFNKEWAGKTIVITKDGRLFVQRKRQGEDAFVELHCPHYPEFPCKDSCALFGNIGYTQSPCCARLVICNNRLWECLVDEFLDLRNTPPVIEDKTPDPEG